MQAQIDNCSVAGKVGNSKILHSLLDCYLCHGHSDRKERYGRERLLLFEVITPIEVMLSDVSMPS